MADGHLTPMFRQYRELKQQHPDAVLLFQMGDFYEMFEEDAERVAAALGLTLTSRPVGRDRRVPMCGVPIHALDRYLPRLVAQGFRPAICEQVQDPREAKGLVERQVVRVVTPGTLTDDSMLTAEASNYLVALADAPQRFALAAVEISTGEFLVTELAGVDCRRRLLEELERLQPAEVVWPLSMQASPDLQDEIATRTGARVTVHESGDTPTEPGADRLARHFRVVDLRGFGLHDRPVATEAAATALRYVTAMQKQALPHITGLAWYTTDEFMPLDPSTRRNLELTHTLREGAAGSGTLLWLLDQTCTAMGARLLRNWVGRPLTRAEPIRRRLAAVQAIVDDALLREDLRAALRQLVDLERLVGKCATGRATPRDLGALRDSLGRLPALRELAGRAAAPRLAELADGIDDLGEVAELLAAALTADPPAKLSDGEVIRQGYAADLDELRRQSADGKAWIAGLETREREATGISSLKVGFNQVFGYYLEVTRANLGAVPESYQRKQTLANAERYITPELKEWETKVLAADERLAELEAQLFAEVRSAVAAGAEPLLRTARAVAEIDLYASLAQVAADRGYVRPEVDDSRRLEIIGGRHPIVEATQPDRPFVPNDTYLDLESSQIHVITGPNMSGKSTYLRQVALICLLAQIGSFVPAQSAAVGTLDRIFTRVGAQDDLASGQSTFMVEMTETAQILHSATARSLVVLDEIGRGTSTYDGLAIAWAVVEYLHRPEQAGCKTLFATHYHDLNQLAERLERVRNYRVAVAEDGGTVRFLHRIEPGGTDRSYGIEVAKLAGLPVWIIRRATGILAALEARGEARGEVQPPPEPATVQLSLFGAGEEHPVVSRLRALDIMRLTPIEAINHLHDLQKLALQDH